MLDGDGGRWSVVNGESDLAFEGLWESEGKRRDAATGGEARDALGAGRHSISPNI